ncbi:MAG TPA: hypothetical protein VKF36_11910 [Syntrophorhabdales bacterium]|nr:hypothetical protein [Syntrophorhabdales bacterium]
MDNVVEVRDASGALLAYKIGTNLPDGLKPYSKEADFIQVLSWGYQSGKKLQSHIHLPSPRVASHTQEAIVVLSGRVKADVFDRNRDILAQLILQAGDCMVFLDGGHGYEILNDNTHVLEIKNGPYPGLEADKEKF